MTRYAKRKLKYSLNENFNLLPYVEWDRIVTLTGAQSELRVMLSYLGLVTIHVNILSMYKHVQGRTPFLPSLASSRVCFLNSF